MHLFSLIITVTKISKSLKIAFSHFPFSFFFILLKADNQKTTVKLRMD